MTLEAGVSLGAMPVFRFGTEEQKARLLPDLVAGERSARSGSPSRAPAATPAAPAPPPCCDGGEWVINGTKAFITNSGTDITSLVTATAVTGTTASGKKEISSILVPVPTPGFTAEPAYDKVGWNASDTHPLTFDDVRVPGGEPARRARPRLRQLPVDPRRGPHRHRRARDRRRAGLRRRERAYAKEREAFGRPIGENQAIAFKIARMEARAHTARTAYYDAAARMLAGLPFKNEAAIAKLVAGEAAMDNARDATQVHGGYGFMNEYLVARHYRDSKILEVGEGTTEVQLMLIGRELGL